MSNIQLTLIPTQENFQLLDIFIGGNGIADHNDLARLQLPAGVVWRNGVIINGKAPVWLYAWLVHQCHPAAWVGVMDPRLGAVVIEAHHPDAPAVGSVIPLERITPHLPAPGGVKPPDKKPPPASSKVIAFVGPSNSGKSVLLGALYKALQMRMPAGEFQREVFLIRACPDGEGNWFSEIPQELAKTLRFKNPWDDDFVAKVCQNLETLAKTKRLLLVDAGGRIDRRNQQILNRCTHAVIVSRDPSAIAEWRGALQASEIQALAEVESVLEDVCQNLNQEPLRVRIGRLERGREVPVLPDELVAAIKSPK
jgi:CRISPR-associated protein Csx3